MILEKLTDTTCRFPFGEKDKISSCGRKIWKEHSYCKKHYEITHVKKEDEKCIGQRY